MIEPSDDVDRSLLERAERAEGEVRVLRAAFEAATFGILIAGDDGTVLASNPVADRVLAGGADDAPLRGRLRALIRRVGRTGEAEDLELDLYTPARRVVGLRAVIEVAEDHALVGHRHALVEKARGVVRAVEPAAPQVNRHSGRVDLV